MGKVKCKRAIRRVLNQSLVLDSIESGKKLSKQPYPTKNSGKGKVKAMQTMKVGAIQIDKDMQTLLKMDGKSNSETKKIMRATKYAHAKALKAA